MTTVHLTLSEALLGFSRVVVAHLDGRGIKVSSPKGKIVKPSDSIVFRGEGMPILRTGGKGDLFVLFEIEMPAESWLASIDQKVGFVLAYQYTIPHSLLTRRLRSYCHLKNRPLFQMSARSMKAAMNRPTLRK
jgi:DnaJ-class molecular chaperone